MKNYLSIGVIALLFALTFGTVKSVQAILGMDGYQTVHLSITAS